MLGNIGFCGFGAPGFQVNDHVPSVLGDLQPVHPPRNLGVELLPGNTHFKSTLNPHQGAPISGHNFLEIHGQFLNHFLGAAAGFLPLPRLGQRQGGQTLLKDGTECRIVSGGVLLGDSVDERAQRP